MNWPWTEFICKTTDSGVVYDFHLNPKHNDLIVKSLKQIGQIKKEDFVNNNPKN